MSTGGTNKSSRAGPVLLPPTRQVYTVREMHVGLRDGFVLALGQPV
jgi:hypothetical protein